MAIRNRPDLRQSLFIPRISVSTSVSSLWTARHISHWQRRYTTRSSYPSLTYSKNARLPLRRSSAIPQPHTSELHLRPRKFSLTATRDQILPSLLWTADCGEFIWIAHESVRRHRLRFFQNLFRSRTALYFIIDLAQFQRTRHIIIQNGLVTVSSNNLHTLLRLICHILLISPNRFEIYKFPVGRRCQFLEYRWFGIPARPPGFESYAVVLDHFYT
ncbi:hypothetical protein EDD85DRAFT_495926 [Armillaria nabsnona]|nr:hypothetical protein EDD85DRAFT_495926 [Armillaria nabsnona]